MTTYRVTAPMVLLKVRGVGDKAMINSFYAGAIVPESAEEIDPDNVLRHLDRGWIEEVDEAPVAAPEPDLNAVPDGTADEVRTWVGDDVDRAKRALTVEQKAATPRKTLTDHLAKVAGQGAKVDSK
jgi:hypothetical protein